jgi:hypothetical protein
MNSFSFNRFGKTLRWYLGVNARTLLMWMAGISMGTFLIELMMSWSSNPKDIIPLFFTTAMLVTYGICISTIFYGLNKKVKCEAFLTLPASPLEKYLTAVIYVTIICGICLFLSFAVGDTLRMVFRSLFFGDEWMSAVPKVVKSFIPRTMSSDDQHVYSLSFRVMNLWVGYSFMLWFHSLYTLGGTFLRKYAFVAASVVLILGLSLLAWVMNHFEVTMFNSQWDGNAYVSEEVGVAAYVLAVVMPLLSIFNYWASFHIFKGFQLINNKWTNYDILKR